MTSSNNNITIRLKKIRTLITRLRKIRRWREKTARLAELAAKREKEKLRREERKFRLQLKKDSTRTRRLVYGYTSKVSSLEKKLDRIIKKNKLKS